MRARLWKLAAAIAVLLVVSVPAGNKVSAQNTQNFTIKSFEADYYLDRDTNRTATLQVKETIVAEFPNFNQNHGILRAIPKSYQGHTVSLEIKSVTNELGQVWNYTFDDENDNRVLKIGDADKYVRGLQTYKIEYSLRNVILFLDDHEEFYWDINGDQWSQPFGTVTARIHVSEELVANLQDDQKCFAGGLGQNLERCQVARSLDTNDGVLITANASNLILGETLTTVLGFNKGTFRLGPEIAAEQAQKRRAIILAALTGISPPIITGLLLHRRWRKYGRDPKGRGVIIPEYVPPKGLNALKSNVILKEQLEPKAVSAFIVELAVKGYLTISEIPKKGLFGKTDYELEIVKNVAGLGNEELQVLTMLFKDGLTPGNIVKLSSLKNKLYTEITLLQKVLNDQLFKAGYFTNDPDKTRKRYLLRGTLLISVGFALPFISAGTFWSLGAGLFLSGLITMFVAKTMPARSANGVETRDYLLGLRDYMELAEKDRIKFLQSPEGAEKIKGSFDPENPKEKIKLFEKLLPYAMLFGIEKDWAKQFEGLYTQPPDWYRGNWSTFNAAYLASSLGGFNSSAATSFTSPSSSGSSGFGGGGSSGGGGGGGGGGGW